MNFIRRFFNAIEDDLFVKLVFDHIRNYGICALVLVAAHHKLDGENALPHYIYTIAFQIIGVFLFVVNFLHGMSKIEKLHLPLLLRIFLAVTYTPLIFTIVNIAIKT